MTLCVGALASDAYIAVSDMYLSSASSAVGGRESHFTKTSPLGLRWLLSYSGSSSNHLDLMTLLEIKPTDQLSLAEVKEAVWEAYKTARSTRVLRYLTKFGILSEESFTRNGRRWLGPERFAEVSEIIDELWDYECLVGGFQGEEGYIFTVDDRGPTPKNIPGFAAIGIGAKSAVTVLNRTYEPYLDAPVLAAILLDAKFVAEVSPHIGRETTVWQIGPYSHGHFLKSEHVDALREAWEIKVKEFQALAATDINRGWKRDFLEYMNEDYSGRSIPTDEIGEVCEVVEGPNPVS